MLGLDQYGMCLLFAISVSLACAFAVLKGPDDVR